MLSVNTNITSLVVQNNFTLANNSLKTSLERMSTGFKINRASDDAANLAVSKNMECQISGTNVAADNTQQAVNLVQTADGALGEMQNIAQRMRELCLQSMNGTYSDEERAMMNEEIKSLTNEIYQQRNNAKFNEISIFGEEEKSPFEPTASLRGSEATAAISNASPVGVSTPPQSTNGGVASTQGVFNPTHVYKTDADAIKAGYAADHLIHNEAELQNIINTQKKHYHYDGYGTVYDYDYLEGNYCLMGDIDFSKISGWDNIYLGCYDYHSYSVSATGDFNGNGYSIKNLTGSQGLFEEVYGSIENLNLENVNINSDKDNVGALAGYLQEGSITNCSSSGSVTGTCEYATTGGLVGCAYGTITNCSVSGSVTGTDSCTGGLVGNAYGAITNCSSTGNVTGTGECAYTGGLVGYANGTITNCSSSGNVTGTGENTCTGGLVGNAYGAITNCSSSGNVTGTGDYAYTGGLVGVASDGTIDKSYATGDVTGTTNVGGLVGDSSTNISNSYALGNVKGDDSVGGLVGTQGYCVNWGAPPIKISNSYSTGTVKSSGSDVGGFIGKNGYVDEWGNQYAGSIEDCYTTSDKAFYGSNDTSTGSTVTNSYGTQSQDGVEAHDKSWFENGSNLTFLGDAYDTSIIPPEIKTNRRGPASEGIQFQIGADSGEEYTLKIDTEFSLKGFSADVSTRESAEASLKKIDALIDDFSSRRSSYGATQNRLESVASSLMTKTNNLSASHSTIVDTDFAAESAKLVKAQILQSATAALLAQANSNPNIALRLL